MSACVGVWVCVWWGRTVCARDGAEFRGDARKSHRFVCASCFAGARYSHSTTLLFVRTHQDHPPERRDASVRGMGSQEHLQQPPGTTVTPRRRRHRRRRISKTARLAVAVPLLVAAVMWASASGWRPGVAAPTEPHAAAVGMDPTSHSAAAGVAASAAAAAAAAAGGGVAAEGPGGRQLQAGTPPAPEPEEEEDQLYPKEQFSKKDLKNGAFVLHMIGALYMFVAVRWCFFSFGSAALEAVTVCMCVALRIGHV